VNLAPVWRILAAIAALAAFVSMIRFDWTSAFAFSLSGAALMWVAHVADDPESFF